MERRYDLIIIGAGPAGMSAAIYGSRAGLKTAMLEMGAPGGKLIKTAEISNWPGIIETNGAKLASDMFEHSTSFGAEYLYGNVIRVEDGAYKKIICEDGTEYEAKAVIVDEVYPIVQYATVHFSAIRRLWSSAAATLRWRKQII